MNSKTKYIRMLMVFLMVMLLCACENAHDATQKDEKTFVLTERQIQILQDNGLPTDYEALPPLQQSAIRSIETLLSYLEDTYDEEFTYEGYVAPGGVDPEYLTAYIGDTDKIVTVSRIRKGNELIYKDNYLSIVSEDEYIAALIEYFKPLLPEMVPNENILFIVEIDQISDTEGNILTRSGANPLVFVENQFNSQAKLNKFIEDYANYLVSLNGLYPSGLTIYVQNEEDFLNTTRFNYSDRIRGNDYLYYAECSINGDGDITYFTD